MSGRKADHRLTESRQQHPLGAGQCGEKGRLGAVEVRARRFGDGDRSGAARRRPDESQVPRHACGAVGQQAVAHAGSQHALRHRAVGGPLATRDTHEPVRRDLDRVLPRDPLRVVPTRSGLHERPQASPGRADIRPRETGGESAAGLGEDEVDLFSEGSRLEGCVVSGRVGRAEDHLPKPGHREEHAAVGRFRHEHRGG